MKSYSVVSQESCAALAEGLRKLTGEAVALNHWLTEDDARHLRRADLLGLIRQMDSLYNKLVVCHGLTVIEEGFATYKGPAPKQFELVLYIPEGAHPSDWGTVFPVGEDYTVTNIYAEQGYAEIKVMTYLDTPFTTILKPLIETVRAAIPGVSISGRDRCTAKGLASTELWPATQREKTIAYACCL